MDATMNNCCEWASENICHEWISGVWSFKGSIKIS